MDRRTKWIAGGALALAVVGGGTGVAIATGAGDTDRPLTGSTLDRARAAALRFTGGGTVTETEAGDDGAAYGVEVRLDDGRVVEVRLDASFQVLGSRGRRRRVERPGRLERRLTRSDLAGCLPEGSAAPCVVREKGGGPCRNSSRPSR